MKKAILLFTILLVLFMSIFLLFGCDIDPGKEDHYIYYPNMCEYTFDEVLATAMEKYNLEYFVYDINPEWCFPKGSHGLISSLPFDIVNDDNLEVAINSFAGKNAGYQYQMMHSNFACYINIAKDYNGNYLFVLYNTNIHRDALLEHTIGACLYTSDIPPEEFFILDDTNKIMNMK